MRIHLMARVEADMQKLAKKQLPFVASLAINRTAIGGRDHVRSRLPRKFTLRNNWTQRGIQARTGNKADPTARVLAPGYMAIQETGGSRESARGNLLAAPAKELQTGSMIPRAKKPRGLLLSDRAFTIKTQDGVGIFLRYGRERGQIKLMWWLEEEQKYEDRFEFETDLRDYVQDRFPQNFRIAMLEALGRGEYADRKGRGRSVGANGPAPKLSGAARRKLRGS